jgi:protein-L-isoaspartate(D-aspartate) O-methyltransferase
MGVRDVREPYVRGLAERLRRSGAIKSKAVEGAFLACPRDVFVERFEAFNLLSGRYEEFDVAGTAGTAALEKLYVDAPVIARVDGAKTISSQPSMVATMLEDLDLEPGLSVFEVGTGTGWNAALLRSVVGPAGRVLSTEISGVLAKAARSRLRLLALDDVCVLEGDGAFGPGSSQRFDRIVVPAGCSDIAPAWMTQLAEGGALLLPLCVWPGRDTPLLKLCRRGGILVGGFLRGARFVSIEGACKGVPSGAREADVAPAAEAAGTEETAPWGDQADPYVAYETLVSFALYLHLRKTGVREIDLLGICFCSGAGQSVCVLGLRTLKTCGGTEARDTVMREYESWMSAGSPSVSRYRVVATDAGACTKAPLSQWSLRLGCAVLGLTLQ